MQQEFLSIFKHGEVMSYYEYIDRVLYAPGYGYYAKADHRRVGYDSGTDFYTSMNIADGMFGRLVLHSIEQLLAANTNASIKKEDVHLVEIGAEPGHSIVDLEEAQSFANRRIVRLGEDFSADDKGFTILFANELLDAQPFQRFRYANGTWGELGVQVTDAGELQEVVLDQQQHSAMNELLMESEKIDELKAMETIQAKIQERLSNVQAKEGYVLDYPSGAELLLQQLIAGGWKGMVVLFDYGFTWKRLSEECAGGTGRGYKEHQMISDLLKNPTQMDITCHICWDFCRKILEREGFSSIQLESQEKFFVQHAGKLIESILTKNTGTFSKQRQGVMQLLHPGHMGQKFQVLCGMRL